MTDTIKSIALDKLVAHPDNPNRMSRANYLKLVRNVKRSGLYEPLIVRPHNSKDGCYEIINGHHRCRALEQLNFEKANCVVWDVDDEQADILLTTLNRLGGSDLLDKKVVLLARLTERIKAAELGKLLPQSAKQIERLTNLQMPEMPLGTGQKSFAGSMVFFVSDSQRKIIEEAMAKANPDAKTKAQRNALALTSIAQYFLDR